MTVIDLHVHSNESNDADFPPETLVKMAAAAGVEVMAIADHNRVTAVERAMKAGRDAGVEVIPAIEIDCDHLGIPLHILGYRIDCRESGFTRLTTDIDRQEASASRELVEAVAGLGILLDVDAILAQAPNGIVTAESIAEHALEKFENRRNPLLAAYLPGGDRSDNPYVNFYWDFCAKGKPAHVEIKHPRLREAMELIRDSGGVAVLAHPGRVIEGRADILVELAGLGIAGIEAYSGYHSSEECEFWRQVGEAAGLFITCGSDFHGKNKPAIGLGGHGGAAHATNALASLQKASVSRQR